MHESPHTPCRYQLCVRIYACTTSTAFTLAPCWHQIRMHHINSLHFCAFASAFNNCVLLTIGSDWCRASWPSTNRRCLLLTTSRGCGPLLHFSSSPHKCCTNTRASWHSTYRCHPEHAENQRQKFVVSHPDCAAGDLQLHERTVRMRVHGVGTDSLRALMRRPTQEWCAAADGATVQSTKNSLDMELGTYGQHFAHNSLSVSTCAAPVLGQVKVVGENHQPPAAHRRHNRG